MQLDTARYVRTQLDTVGYSGIQWICCTMAGYRSIQGYSGTKDTIRYRRDTVQVKYEGDIPNIQTRGGLGDTLTFT